MGPPITTRKPLFTTDPTADLLKKILEELQASKAGHERLETKLYAMAKSTNEKNAVLEQDDQELRRPGRTITTAGPQTESNTARFVGTMRLMIHSNAGTEESLTIWTQMHVKSTDKKRSVPFMCAVCASARTVPSSTLLGKMTLPGGYRI